MAALFDLHWAAPGARGMTEECAPDASGAVRLLVPRHIRHTGHILDADESSDTWALAIPDNLVLRVGDIVMTTVFSNTARAAVARMTDLPAAPGSAHLVILRPKQLIDYDYLALIAAYLSSNSVTAHASGTIGTLRLTVGRLRGIPLPAPDTLLTTELENLRTAERQLNQWAAEAGVLLTSAFGRGADTELARQALIDAGRTVRLRVEAAAQLDDFGTVVRTQFPHPIAVRWRGVEVSMSTGDHAQAYEAILETAEVLLCYCALLTLALSRVQGIALGSVTAVATKIGGHAGGPGFGEWCSVLQEISGARKRRGLPADHPLNELAGVLGDSTAQAARERLAERRNDKSHLRTVDILDLPGAVEQAFKDLTTLVKNSHFLADWSLVETMGVEWDHFRSCATLRVRHYRGDHVAVPTTAMTYHTSEIETGSLYLADRDHRLYLLRPFLIGQVCEHCRTRSTFHIDVVKGRRVLKSLEHGHCVDCAITAPILTHAGLL
ncbi:restriction endonuclease [Nocardia nova]|uniref:restriction endonuclease n=1 Tax=Nocardia nova TaxID=37330 RepID=UPI000D3F333F|nr:restriction endonuclease [Nocardia nova]